MALAGGEVRTETFTPSPAEVVTDWVSVIACDSPETPATEAAETKVA